MRMGTPQLVNFADASTYPDMRLEYLLPEEGSMIHGQPAPICEERRFCNVCPNLMKNIEGKVAFVMQAGQLRPSFALCNRGDDPSQQILLDVWHPLPKARVIFYPINFGSQFCPRTGGIHNPV